jgi:hypothetical protein
MKIVLFIVPNYLVFTFLYITHANAHLVYLA